MGRLSRKAEIERQERAKYLYEVEGMQQKEIAERLNVSEQIVCEWKKKGQWNKVVLSPAQQVAKSLYERDGIAKPDIAQALNLTEELINDWQAAYGWQQLVQKTIEQPP